MVNLYDMYIIFIFILQPWPKPWHGSHRHSPRKQTRGAPTILRIKRAGVAPFMWILVFSVILLVAFMFYSILSMSLFMPSPTLGVWLVGYMRVLHIMSNIYFMMTLKHIKRLIPHVGILIRLYSGLLQKQKWVFPVSQ